MDLRLLTDVDEQVDKLAVGSQPELLCVADARSAWATVARIESRLASIKAALAQRLDDAEALARASGTTVAKAKQTIETGKALRDSDVVRAALTGGSISFDQAKRPGNRSRWPAERSQTHQAEATLADPRP